MKITIESAESRTIIYDNVRSFSGCMVQIAMDGTIRCNAEAIGRYSDIDRIKITASLYDVIDEMVKGFQISPDMLNALLDDICAGSSMTGNIVRFPKPGMATTNAAETMTKFAGKNRTIQSIREQVASARRQRENEE
jgi:hypothetical protein